MSATLLARLLAAERIAQQWSRETYFHARRCGESRRSAHYWSDRRECWPDALTLVKIAKHLREDV